MTLGCYPGAAVTSLQEAGTGTSGRGRRFGQILDIRAILNQETRMGTEEETGKIDPQVSVNRFKTVTSCIISH
ncbi:unnamed protein product [Protopolystoma xenopodis]|uniref:Uncharacterized protein n=1 Tax=Protopolystoma xenopodis TaxID=117903 RepID=A0A3S5CIU3_9PLAT|nr:unnamed protein product [Protopolystoma xenopodis]